MLIEKYMNVKVELESGQYDPPEEFETEIYVTEDEIRHYIDTYLSAEDVLVYAKEISPESFEENSADLDLAYDILVDEFDEHDDIEDISILNDFIQDSVQRDYKEQAEEQIANQLENDSTDEMEYYDHMRQVL